jgi:peptidoglycan/xylan/chitin deacetylase (PgdA/CDA1 family)
MQTTPIELLPAADVRTRPPAIAFTFDDGPHPDGTPQILDVLAAHGARATFFVLGRCAAQWPNLVRRAVDEGHLVANHTYDHPCLIGLSPLALARQLWRCERSVREAGVHTARILRPPFGAADGTTVRHAAVLGYRCVNWSIAGEDWRGDSAAVIAERVLGAMHPGAIVLLHDGLEPAHGSTWRDDGGDRSVRDRRPTAHALDRILREVHARGWRCVTLAAPFGGREAQR